MTWPEDISSHRSPQRTDRRSLRLSLMVWFMAVALLPLLVMGTVGFVKARQARRSDTQHYLTALAASERAGLSELGARAVRELNYQSHLSANRALLSGLAVDLAASDLPPRVWARSSRWHTLTSDAGQELTRFRNNSPWSDVLLVNSDGIVVYTCRRDDDLGTNLVAGPYARTPLAAAVERAVQQQEPVVSPFGSYTPGGDLVSAFAVVPLNDLDGRGLGAMVFRISGATLAQTTLTHEIMGGKAAVYLVDNELRILTRPRDGGALTVMKDRIHTESTRVWQNRLGKLAVGQPVDVWQSYIGPLGTPVFGMCTTVDFGGQQLGLVTEIPSSDVLAGLSRIRLAILIMVIFTALMVILAGQVISHRVVGPLVALGRVMKLVTEGQDVKDLSVSGHNEVGDLAEQFATMITHLNEVKESRDSQFRLQRSQFQLNERMRGELDTTALSTVILEFIADYYDAQVGVFYLAQPSGVLALVAAIGQAGTGGPVAEVREGQGLVGRAAQRKRIEVLHDLPAEHMQIQSAVGHSVPRTLLVAPFHLAGRIEGVMELGTVRDLDDADLEFLRLSAESVAVALDSCRSHERVQRLLGETRRQAAALAHQQRELQETNERLARSDRYKSEFLANMSHELRTPLNSMMLMSQVLKENRRSTLHPDEVEAASTIHKAGGDLLTIIDDILDMSKVEAGKLEVVPEEVQVGDLVTSLRQLFEPVAAGAGLDLRTQIAPGVPPAIITDGGRLKQILKNLLNNACKFTTEGSVVMRVRMPAAVELARNTICTEVGCLAISVADTGIGMDPVVLDRIFQPFNQGDSGIGRQYGGSGLGLTISRRLADLLQGELAVSSVAGKGTTFTLYLPSIAGPDQPEPALGMPVSSLAEAVAEPEPVLASTAEFMAGCLVVLADDEMRTIFRLNDELQALGLATKIVRTVPDLLQAAGDLPEHSVVLVNPWCGRRGPDAPSGEALLKRVREALCHPAIPVVALVPVECEEELHMADAKVAKPAVVGKVLQACREALTPQGVST